MWATCMPAAGGNSRASRSTGQRACLAPPDSSLLPLTEDDGEVWATWDVQCTLLEDLVVLIAALVSERARLGLTDRECIRQVRLL